MILACFLLGLSTRKVAIALLPVLGRSVSPATVSVVAKQLDAAVAAFHRRPLKDIYRVLVLNGVVLMDLVLHRVRCRTTPQDVGPARHLTPLFLPPRSPN